MRRRNKVLGSVAILVAAGVAIGALYVSHDAPCPTAPALAADATPMKAVLARCYGGVEVLAHEDVARPVPADDAVLVRVHAAGLNPLDKHYMHGTPYLVRTSAGFGAPEDPRMGVDFAGVVEAVGRKVTRFRPGDAVFGGADGAFADYITIAEHRSIVPKPENVSFAQAAAVPIAAVTALQAVRDRGKVAAGQRVLVNGASGGVGTFAVQIAKASGARVTGVCSTRNVDLVQSLGADDVIDYTQENFTAGTVRYDLIIDTVGNHPLSALRGALAPGGRLVMVGGGGDGRWLGAMVRPLQAMLVQPFVDHAMEPLLASLNPTDLAVLAGMLQTGAITPVIDRHYPLADVREAMRYLETGRARGKIIIDVVAH